MIDFHAPQWLPRSMDQVTSSPGGYARVAAGKTDRRISGPRIPKQDQATLINSGYRLFETLEEDADGKVAGTLDIVAGRVGPGQYRQLR
jgi:hypothetical protein